MSEGGHSPDPPSPDIRSISGRPVVGDHAATLCHRGIFDVDGDLTALQHQPTITYLPLGERVWLASDGIYTTIFLEGDRGVICFDTFASPGGAVAYRKAVARVFPDKPIHTIVYSHDHLDHTGYALDLAPDADVIAHRDCAQVVELRRSDGQKEPTESWDGEEAEYTIDGVSFSLFNPGATHGNGNAAAWLPQERLLFMVDTVIPGVGYTFFPDWHLSSFVPAMRRLEDLDFERFVPGHYWPVDRAGFSANLEFHDFILAAGEEALRAGVDPHDYPGVARYADERYASTHAHLFRYHEYFAMNLMRAMLHALQGGWGPEDAGLAQPGSHPRTSERLTAVAESRRVGGIGRPSDGEPAIDVTAIAPRLWTASDGAGRVAFASGDGGVVVCNTLGGPERNRALRRAIEDATGGAGVAAVVLTIDHADRATDPVALGGDAEIVAHGLCTSVLGVRDPATAASARVVSGAGEVIELAGVRVALRYPGPTLGSGNLACHFVESDALFVVGPRADARYGLFGDWHLSHCAASMRSLLELEFDVLIPGGGALMDRAALERAVAYWEGLAWTVQKAFAEGVAIWDFRAMEEYATEILRLEYGDLDGFADQIGIAAIRWVHHYLMGGWGIEDTRAPEVVLESVARSAPVAPRSAGGIGSGG
jgi:glyoxylase-like metal-dependent hydrolase (beta-lactamase superfamily II)